MSLISHIAQLGLQERVIQVGLFDVFQGFEVIIISAPSGALEQPTVKLAIKSKLESLKTLTEAYHALLKIYIIKKASNRWPQVLHDLYRLLWNQDTFC